MCPCMLFTYACVSDVKGLHEKETWSVDADDERGGTTVLVRSYPIMYIYTSTVRITETVNQVYTQYFTSE